MASDLLLASAIFGEGTRIELVVAAAVDFHHQAIGPPEAVDVDLLAGDGHVHVELRTFDAVFLDQAQKELLEAAVGQVGARLIARHERLEPSGSVVPTRAVEDVPERAQVQQTQEPSLLVRPLERPG